MQYRALTKAKAAVFKSDVRHEEDDGAGFNVVWGFSILGLLFAMMLSLLRPTAAFAQSEIILALMAAPVAAWLGFTLGRPD